MLAGFLTTRKSFDFELLPEVLSVTTAQSATAILTFVPPPYMLTLLCLRGPSVVSVGSEPASKALFPRQARLVPPVGFLLY